MRLISYATRHSFTYLIKYSHQSQLGLVLFID